MSALLLASWVFQWSCMGTGCPEWTESPRQEAYATSEECEYARRAKEQEGQGRSDFNQWVSGTCSPVGESHGSGSPDGTTPGEPTRPSKPLPLSRVELGYGVGAGWNHRNDGSDFERGETTSAMSVALHLGHRLGSAYSEVERQTSAIVNPHLGAGRHTVRVLPLWFGFSSTVVPLVKRPSFELSPDLGFALGFSASQTCLDCSGNPELPDTAGIGFRLRIGVDAYVGPGRFLGIGADVLVTALALGDTTDPFLPDPLELSAPVAMGRLVLTLRLGG